MNSVPLSIGAVVCVAGRNVVWLRACAVEPTPTTTAVNLRLKAVVDALKEQGWLVQVVAIAEDSPAATPTSWLNGEHGPR